MRGGNETMEEKLGTVDRAIRDFHGIRLAAVRTGRLDATVNVERAENAKCVPGAVCVPPATPCLHPVRRRHRRERVRHPDLVCRRIEHEGMGLVQLAPGCPYGGLVPELSCRGRTTELRKGRVRAVAKVE
jgi:hypothetical protein